MDKRPLKGVPEKELKGELRRRKDEEKQAYKEWLLRTRPKRARFVRHFTLAREFPVLMFFGPMLIGLAIGAVFPPLARLAFFAGAGVAIACLVLCVVGTFVEAFCESAYQKMHSDEQGAKS